MVDDLFGARGRRCAVRNHAQGSRGVRGGYLGGGSGTSGRTGYDVYAANGIDAGAATFTDVNGDPLPSKGNAVYVVDADTGALIWKATGEQPCGTCQMGPAVPAMRMATWRIALRLR